MNPSTPFMKVTAEELSVDRARLLDALRCLEERRSKAAARIAEIEESYPGLLVQVAEGECVQETLDAVTAELVMLRGIVAEPVDKATQLIGGRIRLIDGKLQDIRDIQRVRDEDLEFRKFFNHILRQQGFHADEEERLRSMAGFAHKAAVERLCAELAEFKRREGTTTAICFEHVLAAVPFFSEMPDDSGIEV